LRTTGEGETVFQAGDIICNDYVAYCRGYPGHQSRTVILGAPSAEQRRIYLSSAKTRSVYDFSIIDQSDKP
jgi:Xaa-Pro aminopeptidase